MRARITVLFLLVSSITYSQDYRIDEIPDSLKENANAVVFLDEATHQIVNENKALYTVHYVVAIFNDKGEYFAKEQIGYDSNSKILSFEGKLYDQNGKLIKKSKKSDIYDHSYVDGFSIYDARVQSMDLEQNRFPYIVEFSYEKQYDQTYSIRDWYVNPNEHVSVIDSKYTLISPLELEPNFKIENSSKKFTRSVDNNIVTNNIEWKNLSAREREAYGPYISELTPIIRISPSLFNYDKYLGDFSSWESIGQWQLELNEGRGELSEESLITVQALTNKFDNKEDKIKAVYEYMQNRTRYVSIQLGIGGLQPFPASSVEELGYGDCKALSNYTKSLLAHVGIESYYTWVHGGSNPKPVDPQFAYDSFNHIILCVPIEQDTIWLECTSQTNPFGYQGDFTGDRDVVIMTPEGGKVVHTTSYQMSDNQQITLGHISLHDNGNATAQYEIQYSGLQHENGNLNWTIDNGDEELKKWIYKNTDISDFKVDNFSFDFKKDKIPVILQKTDIEINSLASISGDRLFLKPNLLNQWSRPPKKVSNRQSKVILKMAYQDSDSLTYNIPPNYQLEHLPNDVLIDTEFGKYEARFLFKDSQLSYVRKINRVKGSFEKEKYDEFRSFYKNIIKADNSKVVFVKKEGSSN